MLKMLSLWNRILLVAAVALNLLMLAGPVCAFGYTQDFSASSLPAGWSVQGNVQLTPDTFHSQANGLKLGNGVDTDGGVSFVAPSSGTLKFWYTKTSEWGYYFGSSYWEPYGTNVGTISVSVNGTVAFTSTTDTAWVETPAITVNAGDVIQISQAGNLDDGGAYCDSGNICDHHHLDDKYFNISVFIDDLSITGPGYSETFDSPGVPAGWTAGGVVTYSSENHSPAYGLELGNGVSTDGNVSFTAPRSGLLSLWYKKTSEWGYYFGSSYWEPYGNNTGSFSVSVNNVVVYTTSTDSDWVQTPTFNVAAGDVIKITQAGNYDDGGAYCDSGNICDHHHLDDVYYNISVFIDDVTIQ